MPRCSGIIVPLFRARCVRASRFSAREFSCNSLLLAESHRPEHGTQPSIDAEHSALIDTNSLRNTLDSIRAANRTRLIRKVDHRGGSKRLSLSRLLGVPVNGLSEDAAVVQRFERPRKAASDNRPLRRKRNKRNIEAGGLGNSGEVSPVSPEWEVGQIAARFRKPWLPLVEKPQGGRQTSEDRLAAEMRAFNDYFTPSPSEQDRVRRAVDDLEKHLPPGETPLRLELIGSRTSGLASPGSDVDINVVVDGKKRADAINDATQSLLLLRSIRKNIGKRSRSKRYGPRLFTNPVVIARARVPILTFSHLSTGLEFQVQHSNQAYNTTEYAKSFLREYPGLRALFRVLRQTLAIRGLTDGPHGGLSSYTLLNLILASLRAHEAKGGADDIAGQLLHFFDFVTKINFRTTGVVVSPFELVERGKHLPNDKEGYAMYLEDAADPNNILGRSVGRIRDVQSTLVVLHSKLLFSLSMWDEEQQTLSSTNSSGATSTPPLSVLASLLEANYCELQLNRAALGQLREGNEM